MIIKFIKNHPVGIKEGTVQEVDERFAERMIESEFAKKSNKKGLEAFKKSIKDQEAERLKVLEEIRLEAQKAKLEAIKKPYDCGCGGKVEDCEECTEDK